MKRTGKIAIIATFCFLYAGVNAQDLHLAQYQTTPMLINPAMTGRLDNNYRAILQYRSQWRSFTTRPYTTSIFSFDIPWKDFGFGLVILDNRAGAGRLNTFNLLLSSAYEITIDPSNRHNLTTGCQLGFIQRSVRVEDLMFDNQWSPSNGGGFDPSISNGENFDKTSMMMLDINFGVYYFNVDKFKQFSLKKNPFGSDMPYYAGIAGYHLQNPKDNFLGENSRYPRKIVGFGGTMMSVADKTYIEPNALMMLQAKNLELMAGVNGYYYLKEINGYFLLGAYYRHKDALSFQTGIKYEKLVFKVSYDVNAFSLQSINDRKNGFEISIMLINDKADGLSFIPAFRM
ncbi:MAG: PorP/SprF family type IX secretion system membrane protein [Bacteroidetes bacterium]|nr:PorP/SprF family type IX secretion system membrane protein [Bacteroidota bacterium]